MARFLKDVLIAVVTFVVGLMVVCYAAIVLAGNRDGMGPGIQSTSSFTVDGGTVDVVQKACAGGLCDTPERCVGSHCSLNASWTVDGGAPTVMTGTARVNGSLEVRGGVNIDGGFLSVPPTINAPADSTINIGGGPEGLSVSGAGGLTTARPMFILKSSDEGGVSCWELQPDQADDTADHVAWCYDGTNLFLYMYSAYPGTPVAYETLNYTTGQKTFGFDLVVNGGAFIGDAVTDTIRLNGPINNNLAGTPTGCTVAGGVCTNDPHEVMGAFTLGSGTSTTKIVHGNLADGTSGWAPDGVTATFTVTADAASVAATSYIGVSIGANTAATFCGVQTRTAATSFQVTCILAPDNGATLQYLIFNR